MIIPTKSILGAFTFGALIFCAAVFGQINDEVTDQADLYLLDEEFFKLPEDRPVGNTAGVAIDQDGVSIWVFDACAATTCAGSDIDPILKFDANGVLVQSFGAGMILRPHTIHIDPEGNVWVMDREGPDGQDAIRDGKGHQVFKFSPEGELMLTLGKAGVAGTGPDEFNSPSAVQVAPDGDIFVADGHGGESNARIVKYSSDGTFIMTWGKRGSAPGEFDTPHGLAMDSQGRLFVADRENHRIQIFDQDGNFIDQWDHFGEPSGVYIDANDIIYVADANSDDPSRESAWSEGVRIGSAKTGVITAFIDDPEENGSQEGVAVDKNGVVYTSLTRGEALRRFVKK